VSPTTTRGRRAAHAPVRPLAPQVLSAWSNEPATYWDRLAQQATAESSVTRASRIRDPEVLAQLRGRKPLPRAALVPKQQWIGRVEEIHDDYFLASLRDAHGDEGPEEELAEIWLEQLSRSDLECVQPGAIFYWVIGYRDEPHGQRLGTSIFHFRRRLPLTEEERQTAAQRTEEVWAWLESDPSG
jgi:hypothetical protein